MSKIRLSGSNSGYVEIAAAADAGNLTFTMPTTGTALFGNGNNVISGITTFSGSSVFNDDVTFDSALSGREMVWDKSDNALEFGSYAQIKLEDQASIRFGTDEDMILWHNGNHANIKNTTGRLYILANDIWIKDGNDGDIHARFLHDDACELRFDNDIKLETTNVGVTVTGTVSATSFSGDGSALTGISSPLSFRNLVINGAMEVAQRGTSYQGVHNSTSTYYKTVDRMLRADALINANNSTFQHALTSSDTGPWEEGFRYSFMIRSEYQGSINASRFVAFSHRIENRNVASSGWNYTSASSYITLSYWVKSSLAINYYGHLRTLSGTDQRYAFETGTLTANQWTKITKTIPGNSNLVFTPTNDEGLRIDLSPYYGTDFTDAGVSLNAWGAHSNSTKTPVYPTDFFLTNQATFEVTGLQLEVGSTATAFEHRSFGEELARCQRYCYRLGGLGKQYQAVGTGFIGHNGSTDTGKVVVKLPTSMRTNPSVSVIGNTQGFWVHTGGGETGTSDMSAELTGPWDAASNYDSVWLDFGRTGGGSPNRGVACVVYSQSSNAAEILFQAEL